MRDELAFKLETALSRPITEECHVVYILAEARKLLERVSDRENRYPVLKFYCNWVLHPEIENTKAINELLTKIEEAVLQPDYRPSVMLEFVDFEHFRKEAGEFFEENGISNSFQQYSYWKKFRTYLIRVLKDCPLKPYDREIDEIYFTESTENEINYIIKFKNHLPVSGNFTLE